MTNNIFMISDASYSKYTKCAGLGIVDTCSNKKYSQSVYGIKNVKEAEFRALILSVRIAIKNGYDNVVFVYDNKNLNLALLKNYLDTKDMHYQFLWLKREYVKAADTLANKARKLQEALNLQNVPTTIPPLKKKKSKRKQNHLSNQQVIQAIRAKPIKNIIKFCKIIAYAEEKRLLDAYFNQTKLSNYKPSHKGVDFLMFLYQLLPKDIRKNFYSFVKNLVKEHSSKCRLKKQHSPSFYESRIDRIAFILQNKDMEPNKKEMIIQSFICMEKIAA